jgi:hypothetical protein
MDFRFIDEGTRMDIQQVGADNAPKYYGIFEKMDKGVSFLISCDPLLERFDEIDLSQIFAFTYYRGAEAYTFDAKIVERQVHLYNNMLLVTATSLIKKSSLRAAHRIQVQFPVSIHDKVEANAIKPGGLVCTGTMFDVSRNGLTFVSNEKINLQLRKVYMASFSIQGSTFRFPVEFVRSAERGLSPLYRYDYAFMYNGAESLTDDLNRMTLALFENQLKGRL